LVAAKGEKEAYPTGVGQTAFGMRLMETADLAALLGVPLGTVKRMAREGEIPGIRLGGRWRFSPEAVLQQIERRAGSTYRASVKRETLASRQGQQQQGEEEGNEP